jgi:hypothetical protein
MYYKTKIKLENNMIYQHWKAVKIFFRLIIGRFMVPTCRGRNNVNSEARRRVHYFSCFYFYKTEKM